MNLHQVPETMTLHRALWAGRMMSAFVVIALVADGTIQLFAPAQIASMLQETGFAMDLTRVVGPIILACAILYAIPATAVLGAILVTGFLGGAICAHVRIGELGSPPEIISLLLGAMTWGGLYARDPRIRAILPLIRWTNRGSALSLKIRKKKFKAYPIGYFHIDIAEVQTAEGKLYLYVAIAVWMIGWSLAMAQNLRMISHANREIL
jgi:DoxX-like family